MIKGVLLDYGGTIDTDGVHWGELFWNFYQKHGVPVTQEAFREAYVFAEKALAIHPLVRPEHSFRDVLDIKISQQFSFLAEKGYLQNKDSFQEVQTALAHDCDSYARDTIAKARPVLETLAANWSLILVSNFYGNIHAVLEAYGIRQFFPSIVESAVVGVRKPDPQIFSLGVKAAGAEAGDCIVIGDSYQKDIEAGKKAGCKTIWLKGKGWEDDPSHSNAADYVVHRFADIPFLLLSDDNL